MDNARIIREGLSSLGLDVYGGVNAPYIWLKTPDGADSWKFFDRLLFECHVVGTPGVGFGRRRRIFEVDGFRRQGRGKRGSRTDKKMENMK